MTDRRLRIALVIGAALTIALFWLTPIPLGVPGEWTWQRIPIGGDAVGDAILGWLAALVPAAVYLAVAWGGARRIESATRRGTAAWLGGLWLAGFFWVGVVQDSAVYGYRTEKYPLVLYYPGSEGYFWTARYEMTDAGTFLKTYEERMAERDVLHVGTHPPGLFLLHRGLIRLCEWSPGLVDALRLIEPPPVAEGFATIEENSRGRPTELDPVGRAAIWLAALITQLVGVGTVVPLYFLLRLDWPQATSWRAAAFWPLVPALAVFLPKSDALYPFLGVLLVYLWLAGWRRRSTVLCALAGLICWAGLFLSLAILPVAALCGLLTASNLWQSTSPHIHSRLRLLLPPFRRGGRGGCAAPSMSDRPEDLRSNQKRLAPAWCLAAGATGFLLPVAALWLFTELNLFVVWSWNYRNHAAFYDQFTRTYWKWLLVNPLELALGVGAPVIVLAAASYAAMRNRPSSESADIAEAKPGAAVERVGWSSAAAPLWCCACIWALLWLSGKNMGEAARLWLIVMPWPVWLTAAALDRRADRPMHSNRIWLIAVALQLLVGVATVTRVFGFHYGNL